MGKGISDSVDAGRKRDIPHARQQLHQSSIPKGQPHNQIRHSNTRRTHIDQTQHEGGEREGTQAQRCRIGDFAVRDLLVGTRLELTTKGGQTISLGADVGEGAISKARGGFGGFVLLVGHMALHAGAFFIGAAAGEVGVGFDGHLGDCSGVL